MKENNQETKPPRKSVLTLEWDEDSAAKITTLLDEWGSTGNHARLAELVKWNPVALAYPKVFKQIFALRRMLNQAGAEDIAGGQKRDSEEALHNILSVWIQRMLPGYTVGPVKVKKRRGPRRNWDSEQEYVLLEEFNGLWKELDTIKEEDVASVQIKKGETRPKFVKRIAGVVQRLHLTTIYCTENSFVPGVDVETSDPSEYLTMVQRPLGADIASRIASRAVRGKRLSKNKLLYRLLAFYRFNDLGKSESIRGMIERAEREYPEEHIRKASKSR